MYIQSLCIIYRYNCAYFVHCITFFFLDKLFLLIKILLYKYCIYKTQKKYKNAFSNFKNSSFKFRTPNMNNLNLHFTATLSKF